MFKVDSILNIFSSLTFFVANIFFWFIMTETGLFIKGWSFNETLVFIAYSELFFGLDSAIFSMSSRFWYIIYSGNLDTLLTRPLDPRIRLIILNTNYLEIVTTALSFLMIIIVSGVKINFFLLIAGIAIVIIANIVLALIRFIMSYSAFWVGRMDAVSELSDCLTWFNKYPLVIMPTLLKIVFATILPFYFFSTFSAELVLVKLTYSKAIVFVIGLIFNLIIWMIINKIIWKKGIARYESLNG